MCLISIVSVRFFYQVKVHKKDLNPCGFLSILSFLGWGTCQSTQGILEGTYLQKRFTCHSAHLPWTLPLFTAAFNHGVSQWDQGHHLFEKLLWNEHQVAKSYSCLVWFIPITYQNTHIHQLFIQVSKYSIYILIHINSTWKACTRSLYFRNNSTHLQFTSK